jgi:hypothetical protein
VNAMEKKTSKARKDGAAHGRKGGAQRRRYHARVLTVRASEIVPEPVRWVWPGIIARAKVTGLVGHPGLGKSQVATDLAATVSTGRPWPGGVANDTAGEVIVLSAEDDAADTGVPRLIAAGADRTRVNLVMAVEDRCGERRFNLAHDLDRLEKDLDLRGVNLLVIDPTSEDETVRPGDFGGPFLDHFILVRRPTRHRGRHGLVEEGHWKVPEIEQLRVDVTAILVLLKNPLRRLFGKAPLAGAPDDHGNGGHGSLRLKTQSRVERGRRRRDPRRRAPEGYKNLT